MYAKYLCTVAVAIAVYLLVQKNPELLQTKDSAGKATGKASPLLWALAVSAVCLAGCMIGQYMKKGSISF